MGSPVHAYQGILVLCVMLVNYLIRIDKSIRIQDSDRLVISNKHITYIITRLLIREVQDISFFIVLYKFTLYIFSFLLAP